MVYKRSFRRRFKRFRRFKRKFKKRAFRKFARRIVSSAIETKYVPVSIDIAFNSISQWQYSTCLPPLGSGRDSRTGNSILITGFYLSGILVGGQGIAFGDTYNNVRMMLMLCERDASAQNFMSLVDVADLVLPGKYMNTEPARAAYIKKVYLDKVVTLQSPGVDNDGEALGVCRRIKLKYKFKKGVRIDFQDQTAATPNQTVVFAIRSDSAAIPNPGFTAGQLIWYYKDI